MPSEERCARCGEPEKNYSDPELRVSGHAGHVFVPPKLSRYPYGALHANKLR